MGDSAIRDESLVACYAAYGCKYYVPPLYLTEVHYLAAPVEVDMPLQAVGMRLEVESEVLPLCSETVSNYFREE